MTELLEQAIAGLKTLPPNDQNAIATLILEELEDDQRWDSAKDESVGRSEAFDRTQPNLQFRKQSN